MSAPIKTTTTQSSTLALAAAAVLLALAPQSAAPGRAADSSCRPQTVATGEQREAEEAVDPAQRALVGYLTRRFSIATAPTALMVETAYRAAGETGLDPLLVLAVISIESRFNPIAESVMGARGLMQIIPRYHLARLNEHGGEDAVFDPESNIMVGARILQEYVYRNGSLAGGLQSYNGASRDESGRYALRVLAERERLHQALRTALASRTLALNTKGAI